MCKDIWRFPLEWRNGDIYMAQTIKEERLRWVFPIVMGEMRLVDVAKVCPHSKRSLERWVAVYCAAPL
jgi:hypothetical protein